MGLHHPCLPGHGSLGFNLSWIVNIEGNASTEPDGPCEKLAVSVGGSFPPPEDPSAPGSPWLSSVLREESPPTNPTE